jgi:hypothetical protein
MESKLKELVRNLVKEIESEKELEEVSTTGGIVGYNTPAAFTKPGSEKKKNKQMAKSSGEGHTIVGEGVNRWNALKQNEGTPNQKIGVGIRNMRSQLQEIEQFIEWYSKLKTENGLSSNDYWKRTQKHLNVIRERLNKISAKITNLSA